MSPTTATQAQSRIVGGKPPSTTGPIEFEQQCCVCEQYIADKTNVLLKTESKNIICMDCALEIHHYFLKK